MWQEIWADRPADIADWNGYERTVESAAVYGEVNDRICDLLREQLRLGPGDVLADLGCGTGQIAERIAPHVGEVLAYDYSWGALDVARDRHAQSNVEFLLGDLNDSSLTWLDHRVTKACAVSSFLYLDSAETAFEIISTLHNRNIDLAITDIPDPALVDPRPRHYDTTVLTHLKIDPDRLIDTFPNGRVVRNELPGYVNGQYRFNFYLAADRRGKAHR